MRRVVVVVGEVGVVLVLLLAVVPCWAVDVSGLEQIPEVRRFTASGFLLVGHFDANIIPAGTKRAWLRPKPEASAAKYIR